MQVNLERVCDVCGREGHIEVLQRVGDYSISICHACRVQGVADAAPIAAGYHSLREQADSKLALYGARLKVSQPGEFPVVLAKSSPAIPNVCCMCLGRVEGERLVIADAPAKPPAAVGRIIGLVVGLVWAAFVLRGAVVTVILAVAAFFYIVRRTARPEPIPLLRLPICHNCHQAVMETNIRPVTLLNSVGPNVTICAANWEYAAMLREANPAFNPGTGRQHA